MFVKVIRESGGEFYSSIYEADRIHLGPVSENQHVELERDGAVEAVVLVVDRLCSDFFVMNDAGKTIESYHRVNNPSAAPATR